MGKTDTKKMIYMPDSLANKLEVAADRENEFEDVESEICRQALWAYLEGVNASPQAQKLQLEEELKELQEVADERASELEDLEIQISQKKQELEKLTEKIEAEGTTIQGGTYEEALKRLAHDILSQDEDIENINVSSSQRRIERVAENHGRKPEKVIKDLYETRLELVPDDFWEDEIRFKEDDWERQWPDDYEEALRFVAYRVQHAGSRSNLREVVDKFDKEYSEVRKDLEEVYPSLA